MMIALSRKSLVYRLRYYFIAQHRRPVITNLCPFFWGTMWTAFVVLPLFAFLMVPLFFVLGFFFAARPRIPHIDGHGRGWVVDVEDVFESLFVRYQSWPRVPGTKVRIFPVVLVVLWGIGYVTFWTYWGRMICLPILACILLAIALTFADNHLHERNTYFWFLGKTDLKPKKSAPDRVGFFTLCREYVKAKKQKVCPSIHFE